MAASARFHFSADQINFLRCEVNDWALAHGLAVRTRSEWGLKKVIGDATCTAAPVTLFPSVFPKKQYDEARRIQRSYNELYAKIACDKDWLGDVVKQLAPYDEFIANLWEIHLACERKGYAQTLSLGLFRSDYMLHLEEKSRQQSVSLKQVEFNTIASSFGGLAARVGEMHKYLRDMRAYPDDALAVLRAGSLPQNNSIKGLASGLLAANQAYGESKTGNLVCLIIIVQDPERNAFDQKHIEDLVQKPGSRIFRVPFDQVLAITSIDQSTKALLYHPPVFPGRTYEVTTVYYRAGYSPAEYERHYKEGTAAFETRGWQARLHLERSAAIKCPSVLTHLAGSKKVQQILATPRSDHLYYVLKSREAADAISATFMPIYSLDDTRAGEEGRGLALDSKSAQRHVLKPQREGGGNNVYRSKIPHFLGSQPKEAWAQYILMEMIEPPPQQNIILRDGVIEGGSVICELGCYGAVLWDETGAIWYNEEAGTLLRTKGDQSEEGGVAAGFGAVDSPCLMDV